MERPAPRPGVFGVRDELAGRGGALGEGRYAQIFGKGGALRDGSVSSVRAERRRGGARRTRVHGVLRVELLRHVG